MQTRQLKELESLNRAFRKAFSHSDSRGALPDLLACLGPELSCDRIRVFELGADGAFDNSQEWCVRDSARCREIMHALPEALFAPLMDRLQSLDYLAVSDIGELRAESPEIGEMLLSRDTGSLLVSRLAFRGENLGFVLLENPAEDILTDASVLIPGIRYILSSLVWNERLLRRLEHIEQRDLLTGMGNYAGMIARIGNLSAGRPLGLCCVETVGWLRPEQTSGSLRAETALIRTGEVLAGVFGEDLVFRASSGGFLMIADEFPVPFGRTVENLRAVLRENGLLCGIGTLYRESAPDCAEPLIRTVQMAAHAEAARCAAGPAFPDPLPAEARSRTAQPTESTADITLYRSEQFFRAAPEWLEKHSGRPVVTIVADINYFRLYNDIFGRAAGNRLLESIAGAVLALALDLDGLGGYLGGDNYILLLPCSSAEGEPPRSLVETVCRRLPCPDGFSPVLGVCVSCDAEPLSALYDHALTALQEIKGSYLENYRFYSPDRFLRERDDKLLMMEIRAGLEKDEFIFYLQPQVLEQTGKIVGAEALCRWNHKGQLISPGQFIPTLEKTGMIFEMDRIIWEKVAAWMASCKARGLPQVPISVNVSRLDFFFTDIAAHFIALTKKHGIDPSFLGIEITESAFADNMEMMMAAVERLHAAGFHVLMDDFGSGYSSLSMLHSINLDVMKTDVRFMSRRNADARAFSIVESIVSMAHMIGMLVITEGIETEDQRNNMIAIGENYAQGFLFYRPMSVDRFEELIRTPDRLGTPYNRADLGMESHLQFREMVHSGMLSSTLLDNLIGPAAVLRREEHRISVLQANETCRALIGSPEKADSLFISANGDSLPAALDNACRNPGRGVSASFTTESGLPLQAQVFLLYACRDHSLFFIAFSDPA